jgi:hypothetical protein
MFFFVSRDVFATVVFHTFLGTFGVVRALKAVDGLQTLEQPQPTLVGTAIVTTATLALGYWWVKRAPRVS